MGTQTAIIAEATPHIKCIVQDREAVIPDAVKVSPVRVVALCRRVSQSTFSVLRRPWLQTPQGWTSCPSRFVHVLVSRPFHSLMVHSSA